MYINQILETLLVYTIQTRKVQSFLIFAHTDDQPNKYGARFLCRKLNLKEVEMIDWKGLTLVEHGERREVLHESRLCSNNKTIVVIMFEKKDRNILKHFKMALQCAANSYLIYDKRITLHIYSSTFLYNSGTSILLNNDIIFQMNLLLFDKTSNERV